jgi:hypothetical protein
MLVEVLQISLTTEPTVTALLGTAASRPDSTNGVFPVQAPDQPTVPYIVIEQSSGDPLAVMMAGTGPLTSERWRISCYGSTYSHAKRLAKAVRLFLLSLTGDAGDISLSGAYCKSEADEAEPLQRGTLFSTHLDFDMVYRDATN